MQDISYIVEDYIGENEIKRVIAISSREILKGIIEGLDRILPKMYILRGIAHHKNSQFGDEFENNKAIEDYEEAIKCARRINDEKSIATAYTNIANVHIKCKNPYSAHISIEEALIHAEEGSYEYLRAISVRGRAFKQQGKNTDAYSCYQTVKKRIEEDLTSLNNRKVELLYGKILYSIAILLAILPLKEIDTDRNRLLEGANRIFKNHNYTPQQRKTHYVQNTKPSQLEFQFV